MNLSDKQRDQKQQNGVQSATHRRNSQTKTHMKYRQPQITTPPGESPNSGSSHIVTPQRHSQDVQKETPSRKSHITKPRLDSPAHKAIKSGHSPNTTARGDGKAAEPRRNSQVHKSGALPKQGSPMYNNIKSGHQQPITPRHSITQQSSTTGHGSSNGGESRNISRKHNTNPSYSALFR